MIPQTFDEAFERVKHLISVFKKGEDRYLSPSYSEAQARIDFVDKFWVALGWDVTHELQTNPYEQEVKVELNVGTSAARKRADYAFLAPNFRDVRFYVEAKKPCAQIDDADNYFQAIRYGWNSKTPLAVLTNFQELRVLDCRYKPNINTALNRVAKKINCLDCADEKKFKEIYHLLSRHAVNNGSIERFVENQLKAIAQAQQKQKKLFNDAFLEIDESFLQELDCYREELAQTFKRKNLHLTGEELTETAQRTLDRLVFMRFLEDKLIESEPLVENLGNRGTPWKDFITTSHKLDTIYNGIIFKEHPLIDQSDFTVDERAFMDICDGLADIHSPYNFNTIPIHILGSIYERFLSKIIITTDKRARVVEKPEVRKAGGVYYTPEYIVRYIVENTVGKLIEGKKPEEIRQMRFADIACGSGSFLLGVYDLLLRHHTAYYNKNRRAGVKAGCRTHHDGTLRLSLWQRREILLNNIYGVDIDSQAVEVAQLSLYLKMLEDETMASAKSYQFEMHEALLPSLSKNIVCGNSLIGWDVLEGKLFDTKGERKLNPMNFEDAFPGIMNAGGFDAIVGNPPYVFGGNHGISDIEKSYFKQRYISGIGKVNLFTLLIERAIQLLRNGGLNSYIIPNTLLRVTSYTLTRKFLLEKCAVKRIVDLGTGVFKGATTSSIILILERQKDSLDYKVIIQTGLDSPERLTEQRAFYKGSYIFSLHTDLNEMQLLDKIKSVSIELGDICEELIFGVVITKNRDQVVSCTKKQGYKPFLEGKDISRYYIHPTEKYLNYDPKLLHRPRTPKIFEASEKLLIQRITGGKRPLNVAYDNQGYYNKESINNLLLKEGVEFNIKYILGLLNSKLLNWIYLKEFTNESTLTVNLSKEYLSQLPISTINFSNKADKARHDKLVQLVEQMLEANNQLAKAQTDRDKVFYERKCAALDRQIDQLVYELYGLTDNEIKIIEEN